MDVDLRKLSYFVAVADHQHFGRAANSLFVTQPALSRQIRSLERSLGCALFDRTTRSVRLTPAGRQLLHEAPALLSSMDSAIRRVREVGRGIDRLAVAFAPGLRVSAAIRVFSDRHPEVQVELFQVNWWDQDTPLRDGRADVGYLRRPFNDSGLHIVGVGCEPTVALLPVTHPLASRRTLLAVDLDGETIFDSEPRDGCVEEEKSEQIIVQDAIALLPLTAAASIMRPDLTYIPVEDGQTFATCLAVLEGNREKRIHRAFVTAALGTLIQPT